MLVGAAEQDIGEEKYTTVGYRASKQMHSAVELYASASVACRLHTRPCVVK
jgi:hypothetical protein